MIRQAYILVEGYTEDKFARDVLNPYLWDRGVHLNSTIVITKEVPDGPDFRGGLKKYGKIQGDLRRLLNQTGGQLVTTLFDYYAFPKDAPGMDTRPVGRPTMERIGHVERAIETHHGSPKQFLAFLALHELEAWLFTDPDAVAAHQGDPDRAALLHSALHGVAGPEDINETPAGAPSKRLLAAFSGDEVADKYSKLLDGPAVLEKIGMDAVRAKCPHFNEWLTSLEHFGQHGRLPLR